MLRKMRPTTRDSAPTILVSVGAESSAVEWSDPTGGVPHVLDRACVVVRRRSRGGWGAAREVACPGWRDVWDVIDGLSAAGRRVYVVAGRASDLLTQLHWWDRVKRRELTVWEKGERSDSGKRQRRRHPLIISGRPDIVGYTLRGCSYRWVSVTNWVGVSLADCARQIGYDVPPTADPSSRWESCQWRAEDQARVINGYMTRLIDWWLSNECGQWQDTPGAAAWSSFMRRTTEGGVVPHADVDATRLEAGACFGGRCSAFYLGDMGDPDKWGELADAPPPGKRGFGLAGPFHRLDVSAMYPSLLRDERFPIRLISVDHRPSIGKFRERVKWQLAVASAVVKCDVALYPRRTDGRPQYPTGEFLTTLTTPELLQADSRGELVSLRRVAWYTPGRPFQVWATWGLGLRSRMKVSKDKTGEAFVKLLINSLSGRLSRRRVGWRDRPGVLCERQWGQWPVTDADTGESVMWRALAGHTQEMVRDDDRPPTLTACYAHLTAYGRCMMNRVRDVAGLRQTLWQDTDGVIVSDLGYRRIAESEWYDPGTYGRLRYDRPVGHGRLLTAKHTWLDGAWTLCGIHDGFFVTDGSVAHQTNTVNPARSAVEPAGSAVFRSVSHIDLTRIEPGITVGDDGWAIPPLVGLGDHETPPIRGQQPLPEG